MGGGEIGAMGRMERQRKVTTETTERSRCHNKTDSPPELRVPAPDAATVPSTAEDRDSARRGNNVGFTSVNTMRLLSCILKTVVWSGPELCGSMLENIPQVAVISGQCNTEDTGSQMVL
jgi:hypothetical protein